LIADFEILVQLRAVWDVIEISRGHVRLPGSFHPADDSDEAEDLSQPQFALDLISQLFKQMRS